MKKHVIPITIIVIAVFALITAFVPNDDALDNLLAKLNKFRTDYPQEKVYLQLDKPIYSLNEDIWLKGYVVNAEQNELSANSKILYVDLLDAQDSVCQSLLLPLENGLAAANLHLNTDLESGNYHICAYTKWMQNFSADYFFRKDITIVNALPGAINGELAYSTKAVPLGKQLEANIIYRNADGTVAPGKTISYTVYAGSKSVLTGKALTGANGELIFSGNIKVSYNNLPLRIQTKVAASGKRYIDQNFVLKPLAATADVQFFPEGGNLVNGIRTKVAFKATKPNGASEQVTGRIVDDAGVELAELQSEHAGMGIFALQPQTKKTYTAVIKHEDGSESRHPLPTANETGYVLNINPTADGRLSVRVQASAGLNDGREAILVGQANGQARFVARIKLTGAPQLSYISLSKFRTGIVQFTLFTPNYQPVAERLIFCDRRDQLTTDIQTEKTVYAKREKTNINLTVTDQNQEPVVGSFSIAVTPAQAKTNEDDETSILSNLLLTSDIKGYIEQPNYYFNTANTNRYKHLDNLMLTQGWRRFNWIDLKANKFPNIKYQPEQGLTVSGTITTLSGNAVPNGKVTLFGKSTAGPMLLDTIADINGRFTFTGLDFSDSAKLAVKATNAKDRNTVRVTLDSKPQHKSSAEYFLNGSNTQVTPYLNFVNSQFNELGKHGLLKNTIALNEVKIQEQKRSVFEERKYVPHSANLVPGSADIVLKPEKLAQYPVLNQVFYGLPGIEVREGFLIATRTIGKRLVENVATPQPKSNGPTISNRLINQSMQLIVDGAFVPKFMTADFLKSIPPQDVAGVELLLGGSTSVYGNDGFFGVIIVTTKKGDAEPTAQQYNIAKMSPQGYAVVKEFYSPVYDGSTKDNGMADLRSTIYWNPNVVTDANGKSNISFYNADATGTYKVTLEGLDTNGKLARKVFTYVVK